MGMDMDIKQSILSMEKREIREAMVEMEIARKRILQPFFRIWGYHRGSRVF